MVKIIKKSSNKASEDSAVGNAKVESMPLEDLFVISEFTSLGLSAAEELNRNFKDDSEIRDLLKQGKPVLKRFFNFVQKVDADIKRYERENKAKKTIKSVKNNKKGNK